MDKKLKIGLGVGAALLVAGTAIGLGVYFGTRNTTTDQYGKYYVTPSGDDTQDLINAYRAAKSNGAQLIMASGFQHGPAISKAVEDDKNFYNGIGFLLFDEPMNGASDAAFQTFSITYRADLGSIQTGIAAAYFLNANQAAFDSPDAKGNKLSYSMWGGQPFPSVTSFMGGFQLGVKWANANLTGKDIPQQKETGTTKPWIDVQQTFGIADFTGGFGPNDGISTQRNIIEQNADLIMPVAGPQIQTAQNIILERNSAQLIIGVDSAVEDQPSIEKVRNEKVKGLTEKDKLVIFSSLKDLAKSGEMALSMINNGNNAPAGAESDPNYNGMIVEKPAVGSEPAKYVGGIGITAVGNTTNGMVGVSGIGVGLADQAYTLSGLSTKPWLDPANSVWDKMVYTGFDAKKYYYGETTDGTTVNKDSLRLEPSVNIPLDPADSTNNPWARYDEVLSKANLIKKDNQADDEKIKIILSSAASVLLDASFSQSVYLGLAEFMNSMGISIPFPPGFKPTAGI